MFRRRWSALPKDASFPTTLDGLGYFINDDDEVRSIENPDNYFKFFANKNTRINERQRFAFNGALEQIVFDRLEKEGLKKLPLPPLDEKHTPIFTTPDLVSSSRIVVVFGEPIQNMGILAYRVANGTGGLNRGSMVNVVRALRKHAASPDDSNPPGIVLANMGQRYWWPEGKCALTISSSNETPLPSLVHAGIRHVPELNTIAGSETPLRHMETIFANVLKLDGKVKIDLVAIGESCEHLLNFLDEPTNWDAWRGRLNGAVLFGTVFETSKLANDGFKEFLAERTRGYLLSGEPLDTPLAPPEGNPSLAIEALGCPCYSSSEAQNTEVIAVRAIDSAAQFLHEVAMAPGFVNPPITVMARPKDEHTEDNWDQLTDEQKPPVHMVDNKAMMEEVKQLRRWKKFEQTGQAPDSDSDDESQEVTPLGKDAW